MDGDDFAIFAFPFDRTFNVATGLVFLAQLDDHSGIAVQRRSIAYGKNFLSGVVA